jgi:hypothetical protein
MTDIKLTAQSRGTDDVYWCPVAGKAVVIRKRGNAPYCPECGSMANDFGHTFVVHVENQDDKPELIVLAEAVKGADDAEAEIEILRDAIRGFAQQVHQAYHGAHPPDLCDVNHTKCPRGLCRSVQHVLNPKRPRGMP